MMKPLLTLAACAAALLLTACSPQYKVPEMTPEESRHIAQLTERMTTRCVGRYLIDLPEAFVLGYGNGADIEGIPITVTPMTRGAFDRMLENRTKELQAMHMYRSADRPFLKGFEQTPPGFVGRVFNRVRSQGTAEAARVLELLGWKDGYRIDMKVKAQDGRGTPEEHEKWMADFPPNVQAKLAQLLSVYARVEGRKEGDIPEAQGACINNGFIRGPAIIEESLGTEFVLQGAPDVSFMFTADGNVHEKDSMLERGGQIEKDMKKSGAQTIRKGTQQIHGETWEEWLMHGPTPSRVPGTLFILNANEVAGRATTRVMGALSITNNIAERSYDPTQPFVSLVLSNGDRISQPPDLTDEQKEARGLYKELERATLSPAEALALWDKVIPTLRRRPGAF